MPREDEGDRVTLQVGAIILLRVAAVLVVWVVFFLSMFLGYFTVPLLLIGGLTIVYAITDAGMYVAIRRQTEARQARQAFLSSSKDTHTSDIKD